MMKILTLIFAAYIVTLVLVKGHIFTYARCWLRIRTLWLIKGPPGDRRHLIDCRLCTGFWVSLAVCVACWDIMLFPLVYGSSYFLATQEN